MSYVAKIAPLTTVTPHPNADRLALASVCGNTVVVGLGHHAGERGIYFDCGGQISLEYCTANDLIARRDEAGNKIGGLFDEKRRVRAQRLRGVASEGFWMPLESLAFAGDTSSLCDGDELTTFNDVPICNRYETPATRRAGSTQAGVKKLRGETATFKKHYDTPQLRFVSEMMAQLDGLLIVSEKVHGTSQRTGYVLDALTLPWWKRGLNLLHPFFETEAYRLLHGSRNVILSADKPGFYGSNDFRFDGVLTGWEAQLHKGEVLYYELVGDVAPGSPIMPSQPIDAKDKALRKQYGDMMHYRYGCAPGERKMLVYRITWDGVDLPWLAVQARCKELGVDVVPTLLMRSHAAGEAIEPLCAPFMDTPDILDASHISEGVVIRLEHANGIMVAKHKSFSFKLLEGLIRESDTYIDTEEAS